MCTVEIDKCRCGSFWNWGVDLGEWISFDVTFGAGATAWAQSVVGLGNEVG